ncbi:hypothetical protein LTR17_026925 [Elasticomyces elasticus]|nr:hypothetical protein LTR17_026925 [Elasticomyces elasticus]
MVEKLEALGALCNQTDVTGSTSQDLKDQQKYLLTIITKSNAKAEKLDGLESQLIE